MGRARMTAVAAIAASGVVGIGLVATGTAHAGTKGQQVRVCANVGSYREVTLTGKNQDDADMTVSNLFGNGCTPISGFWWKGAVNITLSNSDSGYADHNETCEVPESQLISDWFECKVTVDPAVAP